MTYVYIESNGKWTDGKNIVYYATNFSIDSIWVKKKTPKSGWTKFFKDLEEANIYNLPNQNEINGWKNTVDDGYTYYVEYATKNTYKFYAYNCPDVYEDQFIECKKMTKILDIFEKEIGLNIGWHGEYRCKAKQPE